MRRRILRIITRLNVGGPTIHTVLLNALLDKDNFESILVAGSIDDNEKDMSYFAGKYSVQPVYLKSMSRELNPISDLKSIIELIKIIRSFKPDIVHTHTAKAGTVGRIAAWLCGVPVIVHTFHGNIFKGYFSPLKTKVFITIEKFLAKISTHIITISHQQQQEICDLRIAPMHKVKIIHLGFQFENVIPQPFHKNQFRNSLNLPENSPLVGVIGRLVPIKNHTLFIDIAQLVLRTRPEVMFLIVGDGELRDNLQEEIMKRNLATNILITGFKEDLKPVYADLDIVVLTSLNEGTPVAIIEAMACGKPIITTKVGGIEDFVNHKENGFLMNHFNPIIFAKYILEIINNTYDINSLMEEASKTAFEKFSFSRLKLEIENLYISSLEKR